MKRLILALALLIPNFAFAASAGVELQKAHVDLNDKASLQEGAKLFVNYCMGCHSAQYMRFERLGKDLGLEEEELKMLMFSAEKVGETMTIAMNNNDTKTIQSWFGGVAPPDLSVIARARGSDWLYTFLLDFYLDSSRPTGMNNRVFKDVAMPHVLWERQGLQKPVYKTEVDSQGESHEVIESLELVDDDASKKESYQQDVRNLVNFLTYVGEPAKLERQRLGPWVLGFLFIFLIVSYALKKEYWRDVH